MVNAVQEALKPWCPDGVPGGVALSTSRLCIIPPVPESKLQEARKKKNQDLNKSNLWGEVEGWTDDVSSLKTLPGEAKWWQDPELPEGSVIIWVGLDEAEYGEGLRLLPHFSQLGKGEIGGGQVSI